MNQSTLNSSNSANQIDYTTPTTRYSIKNDQELDEGLAYLSEHGYVVISDVMSQDEIDQSKQLLWKFLHETSNGQIQRDQPETWSENWPSYGKHGVISGDGIGQSDFMWNVRSNPRIKDLYARLWNSQQLLVSFDGCGIFRDWRYKPEWKTSGGWNHVDQNPKNKPERCCVQGLVSLTDQNETTGGLVVFPHSNLRFTELCDVTEKPYDFVKVPDDHPIMNEGQIRGKLVHCRAGDVILWDSRTIHCNSPATAIEKRSSTEPVDFLRIVAYVSMSPSSFVRSQPLDEFREKRKRMVENNCTLTHWSTELMEGGGARLDLPNISLDKFNAYQKALIVGTSHSSSE